MTKKNLLLLLFFSVFQQAFCQPLKEYKIFQFPQTAMPRIDGDFTDWEMVPEEYTIGYPNYSTPMAVVAPTSTRNNLI